MKQYNLLGETDFSIRSIDHETNIFSPDYYIIGCYIAGNFVYFCKVNTKINILQLFYSDNYISIFPKMHIIRNIRHILKHITL